MIRASLEEVGAGRSILLDRNGTVIAGNGVYEQAQALGIKVRTIDTKRDELIAVRRADLTGAAARRMALLDNRAAETAEWDESVIAGMVSDTHEFLAGLFDAQELEELISGPTKLKDIDATKPPELAWALIAVPICRYAEVAQLIEQIAAIEGVTCETTVTDGKKNGQP